MSKRRIQTGNLVKISANGLQQVDLGLKGAWQKAKRRNNRDKYIVAFVDPENPLIQLGEVHGWLWDREGPLTGKWVHRRYLKLAS